MILEKLGALGLIVKATGVVAFLAPAMALNPVEPEARQRPASETAHTHAPYATFVGLDTDASEAADPAAYDSEDAVMGDAHGAAERICALHTVADIEIRAIHASVAELRAELAAVAVDR